MGGMILAVCRHRGGTDQLFAQVVRIILLHWKVYREELRNYLVAAPCKADGPLTSRQLAYLVCQCEGKDHRDRRLLTDVTRR